MPRKKNVAVAVSLQDFTKVLREKVASRLSSWSGIAHILTQDDFVDNFEGLCKQLISGELENNFLSFIEKLRITVEKLLVNVQLISKNYYHAMNGIWSNIGADFFEGSFAEANTDSSQWKLILGVCALVDSTGGLNFKDHFHTGIQILLESLPELKEMAEKK